MAIPYITIGCPTTGGGKVISGDSSFLVQGIPAACVGDKASCPKHKTVATIVSGDPYMQINGKAVARVNDMLSCGCKLLPQQNLVVGATGPSSGIGNLIPSSANNNQDSFVANSKDFTIVCNTVRTGPNHFAPLGVPNSLGKKSSEFIEIVAVSKTGVFDRIEVEIATKNGIKKICEKKGSFSPAVSQILKWDGFIDDIYDSSLFLDPKGIKFIVKGYVGAELKSKSEKNIKFKYAVKNWVDTKINRNAKTVEHVIRLSLKDGGAVGINDANKISKSVIKFNKNKQPFTVQVMSFENLKKLAITGMTKHWGRNNSKKVGKDIKIGKDSYQVFVKAIDSNVNAMDSLKLVFVTNSTLGTSANWIMKQQVSFNAGYIDFNGKGSYSYISIDTALNYFVETFAHEAGHDILVAGGSQKKSKLHNDTSTISQNPISGVNYPATGEIDLMMYGENSRFDFSDFYERVVAKEEDVRSLIWIGGLEI